MKWHLKKSDALIELDHALTRHLEILQLAKLHCFDSNSSKEKFLYSMAIPMFYSAWEGFFRIAISLCLKRFCQVSRKANSYPSAYVAMHLQRENFVGSFYSRLLQSVDLSVQQPAVNAGRFKALVDFQKSLGEWLKLPVKPSTNFDKVVMTYSNVNEIVARMNTDALGIDTSAVDMRPLHELLNRRNDISHGGLLNFAEEVDALRILSETENVIIAFHAAVKNWLKQS